MAHSHGTHTLHVSVCVYACEASHAAAMLISAMLISLARYQETFLFCRN